MRISVFFTCRNDIASDVSDVFNLLTGYAPNQEYKKLLVAPKFLRASIMKSINREIEEARNGRRAKIIAKMNSLEDSLIIQELYEASQAGVEIDLIVRGVCRLIPGKPGLSENIRVHSIIGRFLEHSRCYYFYNSGSEDYYIGSADWMHRNLDARVEVLAPIENPSLKSYLKFHLNLMLNDNQQRWVMKADTSYKKVKKKKGKKKSATHSRLMEHAKQSLPPIPKS